MPNTLKIKRGAAATIPQGELAEPLFTTDTYDLYIGKGSTNGNQRFQKYIASGTSSQFLKGDGSLDSTSYQTALTFSSPLVNTSGTISIPAASGSVDGYLTSANWTTFNSKEPAITAGTTSQYYRGDKTFQTLDTAAVPENGSIYFTEPRVRSTVLTGLNLTGGGTIAATDSVLQAFGKVQNQISALVGGATYQGTWNANTNSPSLASGTGTKGFYYVVSVAGSTNLDGITDWKVGDWAIFNGTTWDKVDNTDAVSSVNGFTGAVSLDLDDIDGVSAASPTNAQLLRFNGTSSLWENWTPTFEPALTKGNLTSGDTSYLTVSGGTGAVIGSGTSISILASGVVNGGLTLTTTGNSGAATKSFATLNIPNYTLAGLGGVPTTRTLTINGTAYDLSADRSWSVGTITGSGTTNYVPKFTGASAIGNSQIVDDGTSVLIGVASDQGILQINGASTGGLMINASDSQFGIAFKNSSSSNKKWDFSPQGNNLQFNESGVAPVLIFKSGGGNNVRLYSYASNGFLKTSSSDGTLTVDTTSYLPLTGGTLTGALDVRASNTYFGSTKGYIYFAEDQINAYYSSNAEATLNINYYGYNQGLTQFRNLAVFNGKGSQIFYLSGSTGAATFSSSVTATSGFEIPNGQFYRARRTSGNLLTDMIGIPSGTNDVRIFTTGAFNVVSGGLTTFLGITDTGAATFSSSVTANGNIYLSNDGTYGSNYITIGFGGNSNGSNRVFAGTSGSVDGIFMAAATGRGIYFRANGGTTDNLAIASTGAATFSSSVTATSATFSGKLSVSLSSTDYIADFVNTASLTPYGVRIKDASSAANNYPLFVVTNNAATTEYFRVNSGTGAATFSSSGYNVANFNSTYGQMAISFANNGTSFATLGSGVSVTPSAGANDVGIGTAGLNNAIVFATGTGYSERMRITSGGEVLINTTTDSGDYKLQVSGNTYVSGSLSVGTNTLYANNLVLIRGTGTSSAAFAMSIQDSNGADIADFRNDKVCRFYSEVYTGGTTDNGAYNLQCNGTGVWGAGAYVNGSDIRLKENIKPILTGLDYVSKMNPVSFNYIKSYSKDQNIQTGFIAQELKELFKNEEWVNGIVCEGKDFYNVAYQNIIPVLTKAIQELKLELDTLKNKI